MPDMKKVIFDTSGENYKEKIIQECAVVNHVDKKMPYTRVSEYKHLTGQIMETTSLSYEYSIKNGEPYYPIPNETNKETFKLYKEKANKLNNLIFCGRLAEYQYYNMDQVVANTSKIFEEIEK